MLRSACSDGDKYLRGRVFDGQPRFEKAEERRGHWNEDVLGRTCKLDEALERIDLVGRKRSIWWRVWNQ